MLWTYQVIHHAQSGSGFTNKSSGLFPLPRPSFPSLTLCLLWPWGSFLKACVRVCSISSAVSDSSATLWTIACQVPLSMGFSRQEYWSGLPYPLPGDLADPEIKSTFPASPSLQVDSLPAEPSFWRQGCQRVPVLKRTELTGQNWLYGIIQTPETSYAWNELTRWFLYSHELINSRFCRRQLPWGFQPLETKRDIIGTSLAVQWLGLWASTAEGISSIPGWGSKISHAVHRGQN